MRKIFALTSLLVTLSSVSYANVSIPDLGLAIQAGKNETVQQYLNEGGNPNATLMHGQSLLNAAVASMNVDAVHQLIDAGANVNDGGTVMGKKSMSPLYLAVSTRNIEMAKILIEAGANLNDNFYGVSIRQMASGDADMLRLITTETLKKAASNQSSVSNSRTILSTLGPDDINKAKIESAKGKRLSYDLYEKGQSFLDAMKYGVNKMPVRLALFTPYSLYRHGLYEESQTYIPFSEDAKRAIIADKNKVYIVPYVQGIPGMYGTVVKHLVIKKNGVIYQPEPLTNGYMETFGYSSAYGFSIDLFDGEPMDIIAIDAQNDKQLVMPIDKKFYEKRGWY